MSSSTAPSISGPPAIDLPGSVVLTINNIKINDTFAAGNPGTMALAVSCQYGTISMQNGNGQLLAGSGTKSISLSPTLIEANTALASLQYTANIPYQADTLNVNVWNQAGVNYVLNIPIKPASAIATTQPSTPIATTTTTITSPPPANIITARPVRALSRLFAVNTHIDFGPSLVAQYGDLTKLAASVGYLWNNSGVPPLLRDSPGNSTDATWWPQLAAACGNAKFICYIGETAPDDYANYINLALSLPGNLIKYLEGPDEPDTAASNNLTGGLSEAAALAASASYMPSLYKIAQQNNLPLINMSYGQGWGTAYDPNYQHGYYGSNGDLSAACDYANAHIYPQNGAPPLASIIQLNTAAKLAATHKPVTITEFGYAIGTTGAWVAADVQAKYGLCAWLDAFVQGNALFTWYAIYDDGSGPWGLFNADYTPRQLATGLRNLLQIIADSGGTADSFTPGALQYNLSSNLPSNVLLQNSSGAFLLVLWYEQKLTAGQHTPTIVNLTLGKTARSISTFDPLQGVAPLTVRNGVNNLSGIVVPNYPIVIVIQP